MHAAPATGAVISQQPGCFRERPRLSAIIPIAPCETEWPHLLSELSQQLPPDAEVLIAATAPAPDSDEESCKATNVQMTWLTARPGRAAQMNDAARIATGEFLWFLHADTRLSAVAVSSLSESLARNPAALHFFRLRFFDGPAWLRLNEMGVGLRCRLFGLPFGDQGLCLPRHLLFELGGFDESATYGEDHLLVWAAKRRGVPLRCVPAALATSGRKYAERGWARTTLRHLWLTVRQALPEALRSRGRPG